MANISVSLPSDGTTADVSDYNTPINTMVNEINGGLDNSNIAASAAIAGSKLADNTVTSEKIDFATFKLGMSTISTNQTTSGSTELTLTGSSVTVTVPSGVNRLTATINLPLISISDGASSRFLLRVREGATERATAYIMRPSTLGSSSTHVLDITAGVSAGSHTYTLTVQRDVGSGTLSTNASASAVSFSIDVL